MFLQNWDAPMGGQTEYVYPKGTPSWAYDSSGKVSFDKSNYSAGN